MYLTGKNMLKEIYLYIIDLTTKVTLLKQQVESMQVLKDKLDDIKFFKKGKLYELITCQRSKILQVFNLEHDLHEKSCGPLQIIRSRRNLMGKEKSKTYLMDTEHKIKFRIADIYEEQQFSEVFKINENAHALTYILRGNKGDLFVKKMHQEKQKLTLQGGVQVLQFFKALKRNSKYFVLFLTEAQPKKLAVAIIPSDLKNLKEVEVRTIDNIAVPSLDNIKFINTQQNLRRLQETVLLEEVPSFADFKVEIWGRTVNN